MVLKINEQNSYTKIILKALKPKNKIKPIQIFDIDRLGPETPISAT